MMKRGWIIAAVLCVAVAAALVRAASSGAGKSDEAELLRADLAFCQATAAKGLEGWLSWFAPDAVIYPTTRPAVKGLSAIRDYYREVGFDPKGLTWKPTEAQISQAGDFGFTSGTWEMRAHGKEGGARARGKYLTVWRRQRDGRFLVIADIGSADAPPKGQ
jgi:ketosteroid isomerase-like protein